MNVSSDDGSFIIFRHPADLASDDEAAESRPCGDYWQARERMERAAAKRASSVLARRIHQQLAQAYAGMTGNSGQDRRSPAD